MVIDAAVEDQQTLLAGLDPHSEILVLDGMRDGVKQLAEVLAGRSGLDIIHLISHGSQGTIQLGTAFLTTASMRSDYAEALAVIGQALTSDGDLLIYGCNFGAGVLGQEATALLAGLTGADVGASLDATGSAWRGGDWDLEWQTGAIESSLAPSAQVQAAWSGLLAIFTVNSTGDAPDFNPGDGIASTDFEAGVTTLRAAIQEANALAGVDEIRFNIPGAPASVKTIPVLSVLPTITAPVIIDGYTQPGSSVNTLPVGDDAQLRIQLNGGSGIFAVGNGHGLLITAGSSTVKGLIINQFQDSGIHLIAGDNNVIEGNFIGTDVSGTVDMGNGVEGVRITQDSGGNRIGGTLPSQRNLISGNNHTGVSIIDNGLAIGNLVQGNYIGTNAAGTGIIGNGSSGVNIDTANGNTIGGSTIGARNVISGNIGQGVDLIDGATSNIVRGNYIGLNAAGTAALANSFEGIRVMGSSNNNAIGGSGVGEGNVISGNSGNGIALVNGPSSTTIQGNFIGTNAAGTMAIGNNPVGVFVGNSANNTIGGTSVGARNVLSGNPFYGVDLAGSSSTGNMVLGNYIGLNATGTGSIGTQTHGVVVIDGASGNTIGGTAAGARNIISGNVQDGIQIVRTFGGAASVSGNTVQGNYIGTDPGGTLDLGNGRYGILLSGDVTSNTIGGADLVAQRNVISGNNQDGIRLEGAGTTGNTIRGNFIGTTAAGGTGLGNSAAGIRITTGANSNTIGGALTGASNTIASNGADGVALDVGAGNGNLISRNAIFSNGGLGIDLSENGVTANDADDGDTGPNNLQNFPVLTSAIVNGTQVTITGSLNSAANTGFTIEFFASPVTDLTGFGEGQTFLGSTSVTTNGSGNVSFSTIVTASGVLGQFISATATRQSTNDTSEFAQNLVATAPLPPVLDLDANNSSGQTGSNYAATWTEDGGAVAVSDNDATLTDGDSANLQSLTVTLTTRPDGTAESLDAIVAGTGITKTAYNSGTGVLLLSGSASVAQYQQVLRTVTYNNSSQAPTTTARTITFVASDGTNNSNSATTTVTIVATNDAPVNSVPGAQSTNEEQARVFSGGNGNQISFSDVDARSGTIQVTLTGTNGTVTVNGTSGLSFTVGDGTADGTMTFTGSIANVNASLNGLSVMPAANFNGTANLQIVTNDQGNTGSGGAKSDTDSVTITVNAVNDAPSFTKGPDQMVNEDAGAQTVANWATAISPGPSNESGQTVTFLIQGNTNPGLFSVGPAISATGTLTYTPAANANGSATITIALRDNGGTANGGQNTSSNQSFVITVNPVNDAPVITSNGGGVTASVSLPENTAAVTTVTSTDIDGGLPLYSLAGGADAAKFAIHPSTGVLTFLTAPDFEAPLDANGDNVYEVTVQVSDGAGGLDTQALSITVTDVLNTLTVTTTSDVADGVTTSIEALNAARGADGQISLREAILAANNTPNRTAPDLIAFNIAGGGVRTIQPPAALPILTDPVVIDGTTQPGYAGMPVVNVDGVIEICINNRTVRHYGT